MKEKGGGRGGGAAADGDRRRSSRRRPSLDGKPNPTSSRRDAAELRQRRRRSSFGDVELDVSGSGRAGIDLSGSGRLGKEDAKPVRRGLAKHSSSAELGGGGGTSRRSSGGGRRPGSADKKDAQARKALDDERNSGGKAGSTAKVRPRGPRRPSVDDTAPALMEREKLMRRRQSDESGQSKRSVDDMDLGRRKSMEKKREDKERNKRRQPEGKKKTRRLSEDSGHGSKLAKAKGNSLQEKGKRDKCSDKDKDDRSQLKKPVSVRRGKSGESSGEKDKGNDREEDKDKSKKPARRGPRRPSVDDTALLDLMKRRRSEESGKSKRSIDDMDLGKRKSTEKEEKNGRGIKKQDSFLTSKRPSADAIETMRKKDKEEKQNKDSILHRRRSTGDKDEGKNRRRSLEDDQAASDKITQPKGKAKGDLSHREKASARGRPKRRSLDKWKESDEHEMTRRSSYGSVGSRSQSMRMGSDNGGEGRRGGLSRKLSARSRLGSDDDDDDDDNMRVGVLLPTKFSPKTPSEAGSALGSARGSSPGRSQLSGRSRQSRRSSRSHLSGASDDDEDEEDDRRRRSSGRDKGGRRRSEKQRRKARSASRRDSGGKGGGLRHKAMRRLSCSFTGVDAMMIRTGLLDNDSSDNDDEDGDGGGDSRGKPKNRRRSVSHGGATSRKGRPASLSRKGLSRSDSQGEVTEPRSLRKKAMRTLNNSINGVDMMMRRRDLFDDDDDDGDDGRDRPSHLSRRSRSASKKSSASGKGRPASLSRKGMSRSDSQGEVTEPRSLRKKAMRTLNNSINSMDMMMRRRDVLDDDSSDNDDDGRHRPSHLSRPHSPRSRSAAKKSRRGLQKSKSRPSARSKTRRSSGEGGSRSLSSNNLREPSRESGLGRGPGGGAGALSSQDEGSSTMSPKRTEAGEPTSELVSSLARTKSRPKLRRSDSQLLLDYRKRRRKKRVCRFLCCVVLLVLLAAAVLATLYLLRTSFQKKEKGQETQVSMTKGKQSGAPTLVNVPAAQSPSAVPSAAPSEPVSSLAPTPAPLANIAIVVIVQLDAKPAETGFSLVAADNSTEYLSRPTGSMADQPSEVVMEVATIIEGTELVFEITDASGDGLCCDFGNGYYRVMASVGDEKITLISGERAGKFVFTVGMQHAVQIGGLDPNESCKPCPDGRDCGRCAWCKADQGFLPDRVISYQCHSQAESIPRKCFIGSRRIQLHNQYVVAMAGCPQGFEAQPQIKSSPGNTECVEEAKCVKSFPFVQPDCEEELAGSLLVKETCQDKIGGIPFGYSWGTNAPREKECQNLGKIADKLAQRCCVDGVAFCSSFNSKDDEVGDDNNATAPSPSEADSRTPIPAGATFAPTASSAPSYDGYPITVLIQLDEFPRETGFSIMSKDGSVTYLNRREGYYKESSALVVEKVRLPGVEAVISFTDSSGDGFCCDSGDGYFQVYANEGSLILDEAGAFLTSLSKEFLVGDPKTLPPTVSAAPTSSAAPTFDLTPVTIAVQLDQWSGETGFSIESVDGDTFFDWPVESFYGQPSGFVVETVHLPRDAEMNLRVTDSGGDGFCCLYGDGYVKIFAGVSLEDESALLAFRSGEFDSEMSISFQAGPAPSVAVQPVAPATLTPTASPKSASIGPTTSSGPTIDAILVTVVLQLDKYSAETGWSIKSSDGLTTYATRSEGFYEDNKEEKVTETVYLPEGIEFQFEISDFMGDGTCCWAGNGWYGLYEGGEIEDGSALVFGNGDFGRRRVHLFIPGKPKTPAPTVTQEPSQIPSSLPSSLPSYSSMPSVTTYAVEVTFKFDASSSETGWLLLSEDDTVVLDRSPGYYTGNDTLSVAEIVRLEAGEYKLAVLDSAGNGFCCQEGIGFYSLYSNGDLLLFREGRFEGYSYNETFSIVAAPTPNATLATSRGPMLRGSVRSTYTPYRQRKHVDEIMN